MLLLCACQAKFRVSSIELVDSIGLEIVRQSESDLAAQLKDALDRNGFATASKGERAPSDWRIRGTAIVSDTEAKESASVLASVLLTLQSRNGDSFESLSAESFDEVAFSAGDASQRTASARKAFDTALKAAVITARNTLTARTMTDAAVVANLKSSDLTVSNAALTVLVHRKKSDALPVLLKRMESTSAMVLRRTVGLLVELGDAKAVNALVTASSRKDPVFQREVVFAIGSIGGEDAEAYLSLVSSGHEDPLIRASAEQALSDLQQRLRRKPNTP